MGVLLLVGVGPDEERTLSAAVGSQDVRSLPGGSTREAIDRAVDESVDAVVVGSLVPSPLAVVEQVHRSAPLCGVVVLTTPDNDADVRRTAVYAPGMPSGLTVLPVGAADLADRVTQVAAAARARRVHHDTLAAVTQPGRLEPQRLAPASLGALLDHAPFGVLVGDLDGSLLSWNRWAEDTLELPGDAAGQPIPGLFPAPDYLEGAFALAREGHLEAVGAAATLEGPTGAAIEVSTSPTRLEDGRDAVLVLVQDVTARRQAEQTRDRLAEHVLLLGRVSESLSGTLDVDTALRRLADQMIPALADWVSLQTYDARGGSHRAVVRHRDRSLGGEAAGAGARLEEGALGEQAPSRQVVSRGAPVLLETVTEAQLDEFVPDPETRELVRRLGLGSVVSVPLPGRDEVLGTMTLVRTLASPPYTREDLAIAVEVGRRAGVALDTVSLYAKQRDLAAELQRSLLTEPPETEHDEVAVRYVAAAEEAQVGGDWYDAFVQDTGSTVLVIGDVVGHDTRAAAAMGQLRALLRGIGYTTGTGPAGMLTRLDAAIEGLRVGTTATALVVQVERHGTTAGPVGICWSNAGHPPPILVGPTGQAEVLEDADPDLLLGVLAHTERRERSAVLQPGGTLLLYTDGLIERRDESLDQGVARLAEAVDRLAGLPLQAMCDRLLADLLPEATDDDVALVALRLNGADLIAGRATVGR